MLRGSGLVVSVSVVRENETRGGKERYMKERGREGGRDCDFDV